MQKIKYIILFILLITIAMIYMQLVNYQNITSTLIQENTIQNKKSKDLEHKIVSLENKIETVTNEKIELQNKMIILDEELLKTQMSLHALSYQVDTNITNNLNYPTQEFNNSVTIYESKEEPIDLKPNITLDDENKITGFGLQYKEKF